MSWRAAAACGSFLALGACGGSDGRTSKPFELPDDGLPPACHPFRTSGACAVPFPSSYFLVDDAASSTGKRVALDGEAFPAGADLGGAGAPQAFDPTRWNDFDGFSPATPIVAYFEEKLDVTSLPSQERFEESLSPASATVLVDMETDELVPHFAELDRAADIRPEDRQALLLRTARHLHPGRRYAVGITRALRTLDGGTPRRSPGFASALRGAGTSEPRLRAATASLEEAVGALERAGVSRDDLLLAWDFTTASLESLTANVLAMRDRALEVVGEDGIGFTVDEVRLDPWPEIHKWVRGTFTAPSFLSHDDRSMPEVSLVRDSGGLPEIQRDARYAFEMIVPNSALSDGPFPLLIYGHGLLGEPLDGPSGTIRRFCDEKKYVCIGTEFIGLTEAEKGVIDSRTGLAGNGAALLAIKNVNALWWVADRMQQAHVNTMVMTRTARRIVADPRTYVEPPGGQAPFRAVVDPPVIAYYGISQGGIFGAAFMAYSPDVDRGVLHAGGSGFSLFVQRSVNWNEFFPGIRNGYPDRLDQQLILALWQPAFDLAEGSGTAWAQGEHDPLPGTARKSLLFSFGVGDEQVPNLGSNAQIRTLGIPLLDSSAIEVWGAPSTGGDVDSAAVYFDLGREAPPATNETPLLDNEVHGDVRQVPAHMQLVDTFLRTGKVVDTCGGDCSFPGFRP